MTHLSLKYPNFNISYSVPNIKQTKTESCWWAASQMLLGISGYKLTSDLESLVRYYQNKGLPLDPYIFIKYLKAVDLKYVFAIGVLPFPNVAGWYNILKQLGPVMVTTILRDPSGTIIGFHSVVVTGLNESGYLQISDPDPSKDGTYSVELSKFTNNVLWNHLLVFRAKAK